MNHKEYLGVTSIDSLKLAFPISAVDVLNNDLLDHKQKATLNNTTGEIILGEDIKTNSLKHQYEEYQIHFSINKLFKEEFLVILVNTKLLESDYMNGISMRNIEAVYNKLMDAKIFHISFEDFLSKGMTSDIDVKKDVLFESTEEFDNMTKILENQTEANKKLNRGANRFIAKDNKGIEWNVRRTGTFAFPFLKVYHKGVESKHSKNIHFFSRYIDVESIKNVVRIEATIKNFSEHGSKYGFKDNLLITLLSKTSDELHTIIELSVSKNLEKRIKEAKPKTLKEYSPTDMVLFKSLSFFIQQNFSIETAINFLIEDIEPVSKSRMKKKLNTIYETEIKGEIAEVKSRNIRGFFNDLSWN